MGFFLFNSMNFFSFLETLTSAKKFPVGVVSGFVTIAVVISTAPVQRVIGAIGNLTEKLAKVRIVIPQLNCKTSCPGSSRESCHAFHSAQTNCACAVPVNTAAFKRLKFRNTPVSRYLLES